MKNNDKFPPLFSDDEFERLRCRNDKLARSEYDPINGATRATKPIQTDGLPESTIEQKFARIAQRLALMWPSKDCASYITELVISDREPRHGFLPEVLDDLILLHEINEWRLADRKVNPPISGQKAAIPDSNALNGNLPLHPTPKK